MKRISRIFTALVLVAVFCINVNILVADENPIDIPWISDYPAIGKLDNCQQNLSNGFTRGSVKWVCTVQWVCPTCSCTPEACGEVSVGH